MGHVHGVDARAADRAGRGTRGQPGSVIGPERDPRCQPATRRRHHRHRPFRAHGREQRSATPEPGGPRELMGDRHDGRRREHLPAARRGPARHGRSRGEPRRRWVPRELPRRPGALRPGGGAGTDAGHHPDDRQRHPVRWHRCGTRARVRAVGGRCPRGGGGCLPRLPHPAPHPHGPPRDVCRGRRRPAGCRRSARGYRHVRLIRRVEAAGAGAPGHPQGDRRGIRGGTGTRVCPRPELPDRRRRICAVGGRAG